MRPLVLLEPLADRGAQGRLAPGLGVEPAHVGPEAVERARAGAASQPEREKDEEAHGSPGQLIATTPALDVIVKSPAVLVLSLPKSQSPTIRLIVVPPLVAQ